MPVLAAVAVSMLSACNADERVEPVFTPVEESLQTQALSPGNIARLLAEIPFTAAQLNEVYEAVTASSLNGYDEEYTFELMAMSPGSGVGDDRLSALNDGTASAQGTAGTRSAGNAGSNEGTAAARASDYAAGGGLWNSLEEKLSQSGIATRSGSFADELADCGLQIYWPYSENWDGKTTPVITFNPGYETLSSTGYIREDLPDGSWVIKELEVDEAYAEENPVWVINWNEDKDYLTPQMTERLNPAQASTRAKTTGFKTLVLKDFKAHNHHDCWLAGASEYFVKCGSLEGFDAETDEELKLYSPSVADMLIVVKRRYVGKYARYNSVLVSEWTSQLDECALLIVEDDGGKQTSWKATGVVKIKSKSYGFEIDLPFQRNDDIIWRGSLSRNYVEKYTGEAKRYGDVSIIMDLI